MTNPTTGTPTPQPQRSGPHWVLTAVGGLTALVLIIGFIVWVGTRDDEIATSPSTSSAAVETTSTVSTIEPTTVPTETTAPTTAATTLPATTTPPPTTSATPFTLPTPGDPSWTVEVFHTPDVGEITMDLVATVGDVAAYDGQTDTLRCVAAVGPGDTYSGWCGATDLPTRFVADRGLSAWLVDVGPAPGDVVLTEQDPSWSLPSNGCTEAMTTLLAALAPGAFVVDGIVCVENEAYVSIGSLLFGDRRAPDGGGDLLILGDEGWNGTGGGTSFECTDPIADGIDRCDRFDVEFELFEASLPIPPATDTALDIVALRDETDAVRGWVGGETDPDRVVELVRNEVVDPENEAEAPATERQAEFGSLTLVIIDVPALDDSILKTTWAIWVGSDTRPIRRATAWETCARGLAGPDLCV